MEKWQHTVLMLLVNLTVAIVLFKSINYINKKAIEKIRNRESDSPLLRFVPIIMKILEVIVVILIIAGILQARGYSMSSILAGFGIGGLAVGMAAKDALADVIGSIAILADHVYKIGDYVKVKGIEGYVEDITIRSTKIRDLDNFLITVPNNSAANTVVTNVSRAKKRLLKITFGIVYSTDNEKIQKAQELLKNIATEHKEIHNDFTIAIHDLGESSINIRFMGYVKTGSYFKFLKVRGDFLGKTIAAFRENHIDFAFPSRSIYIENSAKDENIEDIAV